MSPHDRPSHAAGGSPERPDVPEPSHAERVRTLLARTDEGALGTVSQRPAAGPFVSLAPFAEDESGGILLLVSNLAVHTRNLDADGRAALLVQEPERGDRDPLGLARATLMGPVRPVPDDDGASVREAYLARHPNARYWVDYPDFSFRRLEVEEAYYVGGFGVMGWVDGEDYRKAEPDPLVAEAAGILGHVNDDHADALQLLAEHEGIEGVREARMTGIDRLGFQLRIRTDERMRGLRIAFPREARSAEAVREEMVAMIGQARKAMEE